MSQGIFRGTCEEYWLSEIFFPKAADGKSGEIRYNPRGDFTYNLVDALSWAYEKSNETGSEPVLACLLDTSYIGLRFIPLSKVKFLTVGEEGVVDELHSLYKKMRKRLPPEEARIKTKDDIMSIIRVCQSGRSR